MKVVFIGCVHFSAAALGRLLADGKSEIAGIVTRRQSAFNSDFQSLEPMAAEAGIPCFLAEGNNQEAMADWIAERKPDVVYCFGWSYLLKARILKTSRHGVVGFHPAALPRNRGRHPLIWALALGLRVTASTFFFMDEGADSGDILSQRPIGISDDDDAGTLYRKMTETALSQISDFTARLAAGDAAGVKQDHALANSWRKRGKPDGLIDWRMSARSAHNLIRALTRPYVGAHCLFEGSEVKIWRAGVHVIGGFENIEPGKVLGHEGGALLVKCGEGALLILEHEFPILPSIGSYL